MTEHLSNIQLAGYGGRTLGADELLVVDRHLASCDICHERLTRLSSEASDGQSHDERFIEEPFHLDYDQHLAAYVDGTANDIDREIVESHVALCSECADDLRDLQQFSQQPAHVQVRDERTVRLSPWKRWVGQWNWQWNPQLSAALVMAILVLGIVAAVLLWTTNRLPRPVENAGHTSSSEVEKTAATKKESAPGSTEPNSAQTARPSDDQQRPGGTSESEREEPLIALNDAGGRITLDQRGHLTGLETLPPDLRTTVEHALTTRKLPVTRILTDLSEDPGRLRDGVADENTFLLLEPIGIVIETDRPEFRWRALDGGSVYSVTIYDSQLRSVVTSGPLETTQWTTSTPLKRGVNYTWQIRVVKDGQTIISPKPPAPEARFRVLDREAINALKNMKRVHGNSHLVMGVFYWKHGLIVKAERELQALVRANPHSAVAAELLQSLKSRSRR